MRKLKTDEMNRLSVDDFKAAPKLPVDVVLNDIRSMMNVGSIFRTADAFRLRKIYLCGITGQPPHREIQKTALGATETVDWEYVQDAAELLQRLSAEGSTIIGVEQTTESVLLPDFAPEKDREYALVMGNEVEGISDSLLPLLDMALEIPQEGSKHSLNVSVAAGIVLYKFYERS